MLWQYARAPSWMGVLDGPVTLEKATGRTGRVELWWRLAYVARSGAQASGRCRQARSVLHGRGVP